jgi:hypothetical protein
MRSGSAPSTGLRSTQAMSRRRRPALAIFVALTLAGIACSDDQTTAPSTATGVSSPTSDAVESTAPATSSTDAPATSTSTTDAPDPPTALLGSPRQLPPFAPFDGVALLDDSTPFVGPATPTSMDDVEMGLERRELIDGDSATALKALVEQQGFAIVPGNGFFRYFHEAYDSVVYHDGTSFVTTDVAYSVWHQTFDKALRDTEEQVLVPALGELLTGLVGAARAQAAELAGTPIADSADRVVAYYEAAAVLLGLDVGEVDTRATDAVTLATDAKEATTSPITGVKTCELPNSFVGCVDYTLFLPRGHYTRSDALERYFRAMSLLGQEAFYVDDADSMRLGLLASRLLADPELAALWTRIYDTTAFLVGVADDYTPLEATQAADSVLPGGLDAVVTADDDTLLDVGAALLASRPVGIDPENASVRTMGARAVLDSYVLDQLAWPNVGTADDRRTHVSPLDLASAFGSPLAREIQSAAGESHFLHYDEQLATMTDLVQSRDATDWAGTVYDGWLYALEPNFVERGIAFPDYMRTAAWAAKSLQTGFGSYTELKHDTVLYVKQGTAGEGEDVARPPFEPRHYVEPDPVAFGRLAAVAQLCLDGLGARGLLDDATTERFERVVELTSWLAGIATDELAGRRTSDADNDRLGALGYELELLWYETSDIEPYVTVPQGDESAAVVADIFRSSFDSLELGTGWIDRIWVIVPDGAGGFQLAEGGVYSYHEFWRPVSEQRLTDEEWRRMLLDGSQPDRPSWQIPLFAEFS